MNGWIDSAALWLIGAGIGLGQLLNSKEQLSWRIVIGRALISGGLGAAAGLILLWFDRVPPVALFAAAAAIASVGTTAIERLLIAFADRWGGGFGQGPQG
jgi:hypothetical protein